jgi:hypothetical protein
MNDNFIKKSGADHNVARLGRRDYEEKRERNQTGQAHLDEKGSDPNTAHYR